MDDRRFDALTRTLAASAPRRAALLGGLGAALAALSTGWRGRLGAAQTVATPAASPASSPVASPLASPVASPGPLDLLAGTPQIGSDVLGRSAGQCKARNEPCAAPESGAYYYRTTECCSGVCGYLLDVGYECD